MRRLVLALLATAFALPAAAPAITAAPPGCAPVDHAVLVLAPGAFLQQGVGFLPRCVSIAAGGSLELRNADVRAHDPATALDSGHCFGFALDHGRPMQPGETWTVRFAWEAGSLVASSDGGANPFGATRSCQHAVHVTESDAHELVLPIHSRPLVSSVTGTLVVRVP